MKDWCTGCSNLLLGIWLATVLPAAADTILGGGLKPDVRLLIDISGSMKVSDPDNLRAPALNLMVRLLPEGSRAGVWIFGQNVEQLVDHQVVDEAWRTVAQKAVGDIDNSGQRTNIPAALEAAMYDLKRMDPAYRTSIVLLTDGKVDVSESPVANATAARRLLSTMAPELAAIGIPVHTVALSDEADWDFLRSLARKTSGLAEKAESAGELTEIYLQMLEMVAPTARVPIAGSRFQIDDSVREFTALVFFDNQSTSLSLAGPSGNRYHPDRQVDHIEWFITPQFALVTVAKPLHGEWQLVMPEGARGRVTVISDLRIEVDPLPHSLPAGKRTELGLRLRDKGQVLKKEEVLELFAISLEIVDPAGETEVIDVSSLYPVPSDGEFRIAVPAFEHPGRYELLARVAGKTVRRELPMYVEVVATATNTTISTRVQALPEQDFKQSAIVLGGLLLVVAVVLLWHQRRRRRRRIEQWERRSRDAIAEEGELITGIHASEEEGTPEKFPA
ncbi:MAG: VWA domain-containing protein [Halieaceae bacterium]|jgi:hypothetical protein|nr:VWA domain-containing protein [Halieaceae bacterium]